MKKNTKTHILLILLLSVVSVCAQTGRYTFAEKSRLASGTWVKVAVRESGLYKITYEELQSMGFSDPSAVRLYGYGGLQLEEAFINGRWDDLAPTPIQYYYNGNAQQFGPGSFFLFWGIGVTRWSYNSSTKTYSHSNNTYSTAGYYFLSDSKEVVTSIGSVAASSVSASNTVNRYTFPCFYEKDEVNLGRRGRVFYGESFNYAISQTFPFTIPGLVDGDHSIKVDFVISKAPKTLAVGVNGTTVGSALQTAGGSDYIAGVAINRTYTFKTQGTENVSVNLRLSEQGDPNAYLNYIQLNTQRSLRLYDGKVHFRLPASSDGYSQVQIGGASASTEVWDVTSPNQPKKVLNTQLAAGTLSFVTSRSAYQEFVAFDAGSSFMQVQNVGRVANQNLHALEGADLIIITTAGLQSEAARLAEAHRQHDGMRVTIALADQIYNEYSSGTPDATAYRWFVKQFYDRAMKKGSASQQEAESPKYLLLFGDGCVDNRGVTKLYAPLSRYNFLMTFQSDESLDEQRTYLSDDYFAILDDGKGGVPGNETLRVGVGRIPVRTVEEAKGVVDKTIRYMENPDMTSWKNQICFLGDDGDNNIHMSQAEAITDSIRKRTKDFVIKKIYYDAYPKLSNGAYGQYPEVERALINNINSGLLLLNYIGHGGTFGWSHENVLTQAQINSLYNTRLPLWVTATCDFSRFDDYVTSAGEDVLLNPNGGGIALYTTTRIAYTSTNGTINTRFCNNIFDKIKSGHPVHLGDVIRDTKNLLLTSSEDNRKNYLNFALLGDPALRLIYPEQRMQVTHFNSVPVTDTVQVRALDRITLKGVVLDASGVKDTDFNGKIYPTMFDAERSVKCRGNYEGVSSIFTFKDRSDILFTGQNEVVEGEFEFSFIVPRDISYSNRSGLFNLYASDEARKVEAQGNFDKFRVGGTNEQAVNDHEGPTIVSMALNTGLFVDGGEVNETPVFMANLSDPSGINLSSISVGHDISLTIDDDPNLRYSLNNYYRGMPGSDSDGFVSFKLPTLTAGRHKATLRVFDTFNNSSERTITFVVKPGLAPAIIDMYAAKNPVRQGTEAIFYLTHDRPGVEMTVRLSVFNIAGVEVWSTQNKGQSELFNDLPIRWNTTDFNGTPLRPGIYIYRAVITTDGRQESTVARKLIVQ